MARTIKQLGQLRPSSTTPTTIYAPGAGVRAQLSVTICHVGSTDPVTYRIFNDDDGAGNTEDVAVAWDREIRPGQTKKHSGIRMGANQGTVRVRTSVSNELNFTAYGTEIS